MIKKLTDEEIKNMSVEEIETEFKNIYTRRRTPRALGSFI